MNELRDKKILIIPDAYLGDASGAGVTQTVVKLIVSMGGEVAIYSSDIKTGRDDVAMLYKAPLVPAISNYFGTKNKNLFVEILEKYKPTNILFIGSITNKPLVYLEVALKRHIHIDVFIFMQDFFCAKFYANDLYGPCTRCLDEGLTHLFRCECGANRMPFFQKLIRWDIRRRLQKLLPRVNHVITSTKEQAKFYYRFGIPENKIYITPLPFTSSKINNYCSSYGEYYIGIAQNRIEKGFQFIPEILRYVSGNVKILLAFYRISDLEKYRRNNDVERFIQLGSLELVVSSWASNLGDLIANSRGVIIPSIWPTTTEFGLLEALGLKKPVFAFNISVHKEILAKYYPNNVFALNDYKTFGERLSAYNESDYIIDSEKSFVIYQKLIDKNRQYNDFKQILCL